MLKLSHGTLRRRSGITLAAAFAVGGLLTSIPATAQENEPAADVPAADSGGQKGNVVVRKAGKGAASASEEKSQCAGEKFTVEFVSVTGERSEGLLCTKAGDTGFKSGSR